LYLQADEVIHEKDYPEISKQLITQFDNDKIDALLFKYKHFYGSYNYVGVGRQWYKREIRILRNNPNFTSWGDAQGFRKVSNAEGSNVSIDNGDYSGDYNGNNKVEKLRAKEIDATIYHYGWVRPPKAQGLKIANAVNNYYHNQITEINELLDKGNELEFDYSGAYELELYKGTHPKLMSKKIKNDEFWTSKFDPSKLKSKPFLHFLTDKIEKITGYRIGEYKDFIVVK
jgi:hypothetical protein